MRLSATSMVFSVVPSLSSLERLILGPYFSGPVRTVTQAQDQPWTLGGICVCECAQCLF